MAQAVEKVTFASSAFVLMGLLMVCVCARVSYAESSEPNSKDSLVLLVFPRQSESDGTRSNSTSPNPDGKNGESFNIGQYWYVVLVIIVVLLVLCVFFCACIVKNRHCYSRRSLHLEFVNSRFTKHPNDIRYNHRRSLDKDGSYETSAHQHTNSTDLSPASLSVGTTPVPSPQPFYTSQNSLRSSGRNSSPRKKRNHSPGHSSRSGSEETIKVGGDYSSGRSITSELPGIDARSVSSVTSSTPSMGHGSHLNRTQSLTSERVVFPPRSSRGHRRTTSNPLVMVSITSGIHDDGSSSLHSAPSTSSMLSLGSNQSTRSGHSQSDASSQQTVVEVDVKVHLSPDQEQEARMVTAAALAESARQLAQSAADFGKDEELYNRSLSHRPYLATPRVSVGAAYPSPVHGYLDRRHLFPSHSSSHLSGRGEYVNGRPCSPRAVQTVSLDRPVNSVSLDRPIHTFPIPRDRYRHEFRPSPSPLLASHEGVRRSSTGTEAQYLSRRPYHSHVSEPRIGRPDLELQQQRQSPIAVERDMYHRPPIRPFHTLESYPYRPRVNETSAFHSLKTQRSRTINGMLPVHPSASTSVNRMEPDRRYDILESGPKMESATCSSSRGDRMEPDHNRDPVLGMRMNRNKSGTREREQGARSPTKNLQRHDSFERTEGDDDPAMIEDGEDTLKAGQHLVPLDLTMEGEESEDKPRDYPEGMDSRYLTLPHHYSATVEGGRPGPGPGNHSLPLSPTSSSDVPSQVQEESPSKPRRVKQRSNRVSSAASDPDLRDSGRKNSKDKTPRDLEAQMESIASNSSTIPRSPSSSTCLSSRTSSFQSVAEDSKTELPSNSTLERQNSMPNVHHDRQVSNPTSLVPSNHSKTLSLPRSSSGLSIELEGQLSSTASGYAATGSGSSLDTKSFGAPQPPNHRLKQQYSYPLQNFLAQPYNPDTDGFDFLDDSLDSPLSFHSSNLSKPLPPHNSQTHTHYQPNHSHSNHVARVHREPAPHGGCGASRHVAGLAKVNPLRTSSELYPNHDHVNITVEV